ncbi:MoaD/ThiS family protein [Tsukamurella sp. 8F]|uniref:MoaD/ThiS family protein n=1 Tax=unclassified Tsukamurella TaxID=2633480 RepID=UPI0023B92058|nr:MULTISPECIES: MoaD/ThiS family protein [unclassified Tsukamurella]MDF0529833.1 MoaD/ThiS family protein [Tsukamurella sp. 8J]MDF0587025.1 MoaD/ThiS family protein [Tsukamurella sp. 8F]
MHVRYFAAARAAAGVHEEAVPAPDTATVADVAELLAELHPGLATVLTRCSYLLDEVAVRHPATTQANGVLDVLPPFAGG